VDADPPPQWGRDFRRPARTQRISELFDALLKFFSNEGACMDEFLPLARREDINNGVSASEVKFSILGQPRLLQKV
jgi:hypothetical protein